MSGGIFLIKDDDTLVEMNEQAYDSEDILQEFLAKYPNLLAGDQIDRETPRQWLFVDREVRVPNAEDVKGRLSLDHLFLDQDGIPTLVEVKRAVDYRIRREVVGQMLDYAANAVVYWPMDTIISNFRARCEKDEIDPDEELASLLEPDSDPDEFWEKVKTNLQSGKVRLLFIADEIPSELRRIVEFLNEQMDPAEVLAIEIKQFIGESLRTLVPRLIGQTEEARQKKHSVYRRKITRAEFIDMLDENGRQVFKKILGFAEERFLFVRWGQKGFSLSVEKEDRHVPILFGFAPSALFGQTITTSFYGQGGIMRKLDCDDSVIDTLLANDHKKLFSVPSGNDFKCFIDHPFSEDELSVLFDWLDKIMLFVKETPSKNNI
ncbi:hypothetical protein ACFL7E_03460 [Thermodesulfobacteriota bacterium]